MIIRFILFVNITLRLIDTFMSHREITQVYLMIIHFILFVNITLWVIDTFMSHREITQVQYIG